MPYPQMASKPNFASLFLLMASFPDFPFCFSIPDQNFGTFCLQPHTHLSHLTYSCIGGVCSCPAPMGSTGSGGRHSDSFFYTCSVSIKPSPSFISLLTEGGGLLQQALAAFQLVLSPLLACCWFGLPSKAPVVGWLWHQMPPNAWDP